MRASSSNQTPLHLNQTTNQFHQAHESRSFNARYEVEDLKKIFEKKWLNFSAQNSASLQSSVNLNKCVDLIASRDWAMAAKQIIDDLDAYNGLDSSIRSSLFKLLEKFGFKDITNNHGDPYQIDFRHANSKLSASQMNSLLETSNKFFNALLDRLGRINQLEENLKKSDIQLLSSHLMKALDSIDFCAQGIQERFNTFISRSQKVSSPHVLNSEFQDLKKSIFEQTVLEFYPQSSVPEEIRAGSEVHYVYKAFLEIGPEFNIQDTIKIHEEYNLSEYINQDHSKLLDQLRKNLSPDILLKRFSQKILDEIKTSLHEKGINVQNKLDFSENVLQKLKEFVEDFNIKYGIEIDLKHFLVSDNDNFNQFCIQNKPDLLALLVFSKIKDQDNFIKIEPKDLFSYKSNNQEKTVKQLGCLEWAEFKHTDNTQCQEFFDLDEFLEAIQEQGNGFNVDDSSAKKEFFDSKLVEAIENRNITTIDQLAKLNLSKVSNLSEENARKIADHFLKSASMGSVQDVLFCLKPNIDVNLNTVDSLGRTALMNASTKGKTEVVNALIKSEANVDAQDNDGCTALHYASVLGHINVVDALIEAGAKVGGKDIYGVTALHFASEGGYIEIVKALIKAKAKVDEKTIDGVTALHYASDHGHIDVVKALIEANAKIDEKDNNGATALHYASSHSHIDVVKALIEANAKIDEKDNLSN